MRGRRRGIAIFIVMIVALILGAIVAILWKSSAPSGTQAEQSFEKRQAEYLAKGAQQHALLKCRLLPTELYDAVSYSIGRNPYYDFGLGLKQPLEGDRISAVDANRAPGPMFYTGSNRVDLKPGANAGDPQRIVVDRTGDIEGSYKDRMGLLLSMFIYDISTLFPSPGDLDKSVVVVSSKDHTDKAMSPIAGGPWADPFVGNYKVQTLRILGLQGGRRYDRDTMLLTTVGSVKRAGQVSPVTSIGGQPKKLESVRQTSHEEVHGTFGEFSSSFEDMEKYSERMGNSDDATKNEDAFTESSGRRTEIATGVYYITRKAFNADTDP